MIDAKYYLFFDKLGDIERRGPLLWGIDRYRTEDVKNHIFDLLLILDILFPKFNCKLDKELMKNYIFIHDLSEVITGDITAFEGIDKSEIDRVTLLAIDFIEQSFSEFLTPKTILKDYESKITLESKIVNMIDKIQSAIPFLKYESEKNIEYKKQKIYSRIKNMPLIKECESKKMDLGDMFFLFHLEAVSFTDDECIKYNLTKNDANNIINVIKDFANNIYSLKTNKSIKDLELDFPKDAQIYNHLQK